MDQRGLGWAGAVALASISCEAVASPSFVDDFTGDRLAPQRWFVSDGWRNGEHQLCTWSASNVDVAAGALRLRLAGAKGGTTCAEIQTREAYGYGLWEARLRPVTASGVVSAVFAFIGPVHGRSHEEIDVEFLGKDTRIVQLNYFTGGNGGNEQLIPLAFDAATVMRDYAFEWAPEALRWYVDGELVHEVRGDALPEPPAKFYISLWNGRDAGWLGEFQARDLPLDMVVERVAFTARGEPCYFEDSLVCARASAEED